MATQDVEEVAAGTTLGGKFLVTRTIGVGGMGAVYEVQHTITRHKRALKLLHPSVRVRHPDVVRRFLREASVAGTLGDPHIVETFDAGELDTGEPYLLMELLDGEPLATRIRRAPMSIVECAGIAMQLCTAVDVAHRSGIVHRDLKPENVFLCRDSAFTPRSADGVPFVKVLDFGISKFTSAAEGEAGKLHGDAATSEGLALGTPYYMPPEQARGLKDLDGRADVYALGVILYEMLTGRRPYDADSMAHLVILIHEGKPTPPRTLRAAIPVALESIVLRAMAADRNARVATAKELGELVAPFLATPEQAPDPALDRTAPAALPMAVNVAPTVEPALAATRPALGSGLGLATTAAVSAALASPTPTSPPGPRRPWLAPLVAVVVVGAAIGGAIVMRSRAPSSPTHEDTAAPIASSSPSSTATTAAAPERTTAPIASSVASSNTTPAPSPSPSFIPSVAPVASAPTIAPKASVTLKPAPSSSGSSKVQKGGLAGEL